VERINDEGAFIMGRMAAKKRKKRKDLGRK
jgi:hypothetical protein